jgi:hypothetical protein
MARAVRGKPQWFFEMNNRRTGRFFGETRLPFEGAGGACW